MTKITIICESDPFKGADSFQKSGTQDAPPIITDLKTESTQGFSALKFQGDGPPSLADTGTLSNSGTPEDLKGAGPPSIASLTVAGACGTTEDLKGAEPPLISGVAEAIATPVSEIALGQAGPPPLKLSSNDKHQRTSRK